MLVPVNALRLSILFARELVTILRSQMASIRGAIGPLLIMDGLLMRFQVVRSLSGDLTGGLALLYARLLIVAAIVDVVSFVVGGLGEN